MYSEKVMGSGQIEEAYENARNGSARDYVLVEK